LPSFHFDKAEVIASFDADFLGTWISPVAFAAAYAKGRRPDEGEAWMSRHIQLESRFSLTGSVADRRVRVAPAEIPTLLGALCRALEGHAGEAARLARFEPDAGAVTLTEGLAAELWRARGRALVVCGQNSLEAQLLTAYANELLEGYGKTLSVARPSQQCAGDDAALEGLRAELEAGAVNPAYDLPAGFGAALAKAGTLIVHTPGQDETAQLAAFLLPKPHALEAWGDGEPEHGRLSLAQPALPPLREARTLRHILRSWSGDGREDYDLLQDTWRREVHARVAAGDAFETFFERALHDGYLEQPQARAAEPPFRRAAVHAPSVPPETPGLTLVLYPKLSQLDGRHAHNPWLQELPDPVSKVSWDNYACLSPARAETLGVADGDLVRLSVGEGEILELAVLVQRGQHDDVVAVALGYGRIGTDRFAGVGPDWLEGKPTVEAGGVVGVRAANCINLRAGNLRYDVPGLAIEPIGGRRDLASTQDHHTMVVPAHLAPAGGEVRDAVRTAVFADFKHDPEHALSHGHHFPEAELWEDDHDAGGHRWGMAVDLTSCIGCAACAIGCQAENNVPVVGKDEVLRHREMHWMRIDRYFSGEGDDVTAAHQPMFCQQCDNAPCESVCPVLATVHSSEGLNQQVYNRCVGTRYCANTCPYKVRRFNWFDYPREDELANQVLNPDVTVRTRGVMEKCSFCAQRIQEAKSEAIRRGTPLLDGDIQVACQQSCPTRAIEFGDLADPESRVSKLAERRRSYRVLEELNVKPSVNYLARIRNQEPESGHHDG
jgi:molybdopterin-containing oxidoreductase family iron-sulfur binding subunit